MSTRPYFLLLAIATTVGTLGCSTSAFAPKPADVPAATPFRTYRSPATTGLVVPLYVDPGKTWNAVIGAKLAHSSVPFVIVANVDNGPGSSIKANYLDFIVKAQKAGIYVLGYVYTKYGKRPAAKVDADIARWEALYRTDGVFLDQMASDAPSYYQTATAYAHKISLWFVMGNPGTDAPGNSGPDVVNFYERSGYPKLAFLRKPAHQSYGRGTWSFMAGAVPFNGPKIKAAAKYVAYLYVTDGKEPECYCKLPSYFDQLVEALDTP